MQRYLNPWGWILVAVQPCRQRAFCWQTYPVAYLGQVLLCCMSTSPLSIIVQGLCEPTSTHPPFKIPGPLKASGRHLLTPWGFQVALQSFKKLCLVPSQKLAAFTKAGVKCRAEFGSSIWEEREARGPVSTLQSCGACLARSYTSEAFRKTVPKGPHKAWRTGRPHSSLVLASSQTIILGSKVCCVF